MKMLTRLYLIASGVAFVVFAWAGITLNISPIIIGVMLALGIALLISAPVKD